MTYQEALDALRSAAPQHPLLRLLSLNESSGNRLILDNELSKFSSEPARSAAAPPSESETDDFTPDPPDDPVLRRLRMQQSSLFADRAKLSNTFFDCAGKAQRKKVSENIQIIQAQIEMVREEIRTYRAHGRLAEPDEKYPIPEDPFKLIALLNSLRSSISRKSKEIHHLGAEVLDEKPGAADKLAKAETKMRELQTHLNHVQKAIKDRNIQLGRLSEG